MGSSKTAQALITKFNYENNGDKVLFLKPSTDTRDGKTIVKSRIGISGEAIVVDENTNVYDFKPIEFNVVICDESQFFTPSQIDGLKFIAVYYDIPVLCYGLLTDFKTNLFPGSKRLIELADSLQEIKMICECGKKATVNARMINNKVVTKGEQILLGSNELYKPMCYECWRKYSE